MRSFLIVLLAAGAVVGFASALAEGRRQLMRRAGWERRAAQICTQGARSAGSGSAPDAPRPEAGHGP
jgi:hypothetical protein